MCILKAILYTVKSTFLLKKIVKFIAMHIIVCFYTSILLLLKGELQYLNIARLLFKRIDLFTVYNELRVMLITHFSQIKLPTIYYKLDMINIDRKLIQCFWSHKIAQKKDLEMYNFFT